MPSPARISRWILAVCCLLPLFSAVADTAVFDLGSRPRAGLVSGSLLPERPFDYVHDNLGHIDATQRAELRKRLEQTAGRGIEIFVLALKEIPETEPYQLGNEILLRWGDQEKDVNALVLHLPSVNPEPYVIIFRREVDGANNVRFKNAGRRAVALTMRSVPEAEILPAAVLALAKELTTLQEKIAEERKSKTTQPIEVSVGMGETLPAIAGSLLRDSGGERPKATLTEGTSHLDLFLDKLSWESMKPIVTAFGGLFAVGVVILVLTIRHRCRPRYFPDVKPRTRFSGLYSGGNNAMISVQKNKLRAASSHG